jgi:hypothetical protein
VARLSYLVRVLPDVKFVIPVREPASHIASLMRQHQQFSQAQKRNRRALVFMQRSGHFEFGLDRRPLNLGNTAQVQQILLAWRRGDEIRGWAKYWDLVYGHVAGVLASDPLARTAALVVRFETLCRSPRDTVQHLLAHCRLSNADPILDRYVGSIKYPDYYRQHFSADELSVIHEETESTAKQFGY